MITEERLQEIKLRFGIIGQDIVLNRAIERAYQVAPTDYSVLVIGESGVGKEFFPKIVHTYSNRKHAPYIAINCGAIPNGTIDSELFGHVKGAFTGAVGDHKGYFEEADGGTIFLDEVGELPIETQVRLLRVLETGEFIRVGSSQVQKTNVRVVAATNVNIQEAIQMNKFREDLFYRLSTITIRVPALRDRKEDIPVLFRKFAADCTERYQMPPVRLTEDAKQLLMSCYWRGNIRQLKNIAEQVCVLEQKREITATLLKPYLPTEEGWTTPAVISRSEANSATEREILYKILFDMKREIDDLRQTVAQISVGQLQVKPMPVTPSTTEEPNYPLTTVSEQETASYQQAEELHSEESVPEELSPLQNLERDAIRNALKHNNGNRKLAAKEIGMPERTFYRKLKDYNIN